MKKSLQKIVFIRIFFYSVRSRTAEKPSSCNSSASRNQPASSREIRWEVFRWRRICLRRVSHGRILRRSRQAKELCAPLWGSLSPLLYSRIKQRVITLKIDLIVSTRSRKFVNISFSYSPTDDFNQRINITFIMHISMLMNSHKLLKKKHIGLTQLHKMSSSKSL